jgi:transposase-like protein
VTPAAVDAMASLVDDEVVRLTGRARAHGLRLVGDGGLLPQLTKRVLEAALESELDSHLGYGKHDTVGRDGGNSRNCPRRC